VGERRAHVGDDGGGAREERCPAYVGRGRHQDLTRLKSAAVFHGMNDAYHTLDDALRARKAFDESLRLGGDRSLIRVEKVGAAVRCMICSKR